MSASNESSAAAAGSVTSAASGISGPDGQSPPASRAAFFAKIDRDITFLGDCLATALGGEHERALRAAIPRCDADGKVCRLGEVGADDTRELMQVLSIWFQLLNMVEENVAMQARRAREREHQDGEEPGLWSGVLAELRAAGIDGERVREALCRFQVEPVLTAHPTEAKRPAVLRLHRELYLHLFELENTNWTASEREDITAALTAALERLWRSGEIAIAKPSVEDELDNVLHYLKKVFPLVVPFLDRRFRRAWGGAGYAPEDLRSAKDFPSLSFGNWVGGDRDGHALVNADVTRHTLRKLRLAALELLHEQMLQVADRLTLSRRIQSPPPALYDALHEWAAELDIRVRELEGNDEPWQQFAELIALRLKAEIESARAGGQGTLRAEELDEALAALEEAVVEIGAERIAEDQIWPARRLVHIFGLHLANLDIRQNSGFHDSAIEQLLQASGASDWHFSEWDEAKRLDMLTRELRSEDAWQIPRNKLGKEAKAVLDTYRVLAAHLRYYGRDGLGSLIISMTRSVSDLLAVYLLAREAGLSRFRGGIWRCPLPVVPLLETLDDLQRAPEILRDYLSEPVVRLSLAKQQHPRLQAEALVTAPITQQVMIGYSDSNKDAGFLASQWGLFQAQQQIAETVKASNAAVVFFHGRGGTVSRGAGPTHRFLEALPPGSLQAALRLTEQGETIAQKYANQGTATYNLEMLQAGTLRSGLLRAHAEAPSAELVNLLDSLAARSTEAYRGLLEAPDFLAYWSAATPIDVLEFATIGSRPVRRTGRKSLDDLRAIPWVFSWTQSRHYLTGWYGFGSAISALDEDALATLRQAVQDWPFWRYCVYNLQTSFASADPDLIRAYAGLVEDAEVRERFLDTILGEYERCREAIDALAGPEWLARRPRMVKTLSMRAEPLRALHHEQIRLLGEWRAIADSESEADAQRAETLRKLLVQSVNAISSGLRTVG